MLAAAVGLVLAGGGTALGATVAGGPVDSAGVIHGCWTTASRNGAHMFVLEDHGSRCPRGTTAISWNQTGPQGPKGNTGPAGKDGANGTDGTNGTNGHSVLSGAGTPDAGAGSAGDFYIDTTALQIYGPRSDSGWGSPTNLVGANGKDGANGQNGTNGSSVLNGHGAPDPATVGSTGDFYIDTTALQIYGPKSEAGWGSPTSLVGPKGDPGTPGTAGQNASLKTTVVSADVTATADQIQVWDITGQGGSITRTVTCPADFPLAVVGSVTSDKAGDGPLGDNSYQRSSWTATMSWVYVRPDAAHIHFQLTCLGA